MTEASLSETPEKPHGGNWNVALPTLGGVQFWTDQFIYQGWRIQKNVWTGHCRLLDPNNIRRAWGKFESCRNKFESVKKSKAVPQLSGKAVILLHGLGRTRRSMARLAKYLKDLGYLPINIEYASMRAPIKHHAENLHRIIDKLDGIEEIYFVGHSMGNIVWRYYLQDRTDVQTGVQGDPRIRASVMIAPPNRGAWLARLLKPTVLFGLITGKSGLQLASKHWDQFTEELATPNHPFAIIAGKYNCNPLFRVDNDTTVSVEETMLNGADDFQIVRSMHAFIMANPNVIKQVASFLENGFLVSKESRHPLKNSA